MFFALSYYAIDGRKWFRGPRINVAHVSEGDLDGGRLNAGDETPEKKQYA